MNCLNNWSGINAFCIRHVRYDGYGVNHRGVTDEEVRFTEMISTIHPNTFRRYGIGRSQFYKLKDRVDEVVPLHLSTKTKVRLRTMSEGVGVTP